MKKLIYTLILGLSLTACYAPPPDAQAEENVPPSTAPADNDIDTPDAVQQDTADEQIAAYEAKQDELYSYHGSSN